MDIKDFVIQNTAGNLYWKDLNGIYRGCNKNMANIFGLSCPEDIVGKNDYDFYLDAQHVEKIIENDQLVIKSMTEHVFEELGTGIHGKPAWYITKKTPWRDNNGDIAGIVGVSIDITEQKHAEKEKELALLKEKESQAKAEAEESLRICVTVLAGRIAHDLRTPLAILSMLGKNFQKHFPILLETYLTAAEEKKLSQPMKDQEFESIKNFPKDIAVAIKKIHEYIDSTLKMLSNITSGNVDADDFKQYNIHHVIQETLKTYPYINEEKSLVIWNAGENFRFLGNDLLLMHNFFNLMKNSFFQIAQNKKGKIFITTERGGHYNTVRIRDTAGGAPPEVVANLFSGYKTTKKGGTGVGLASCKLTMESFGGDISCHSVQGDYIEFVLRFPVVAEDLQG